KLIGLLVLGLAGYLTYRPLATYWHQRNVPQFRTAEVVRGDITYSVNATGVINPVRSVHVGSFVSGPIEGLFKDFNDRVKKDELLAKIDPRIYAAAVARDEAQLVTQQAEVERVEALLQQARNNEARAKALRAENKDFISDTEMDQVVFNRKSLEAQLAVAKSMVKQAEANSKNSRAN